MVLSSVVAPRHCTAGVRLVQHSLRRLQPLKAAQTLTAVEAPKKEKKAAKKDVEKVTEPEVEDAYESQGLTPQQVGNLLSVLCDETEIAEVELKMGGFQLKVRRKLAPLAVAAAPAPVHAAAPSAAAAAPAAASSTPSAVSTATLDEEDELERILSVYSPKVGVMRTARYVKGKKVGKGPLVQVGDQVKKGQVIYFVEQLGTHVAVEASQAGEVIALFKEDGDPVEYDEEVAHIAPFFSGHIIGESKWAV